MRTCVFAGTFDPITKGHEYVVNKCLETFDKVVIAVGVNVDKKPLFSLEERVDIIKETFKGDERVEVATFNGMLVEFMKSRGIKHTVRGLRNQDDYKYETTMAHFNQDMYDEIITMYIPTPSGLTYVSSSAIRNIIALSSDISVYVPDRAIKKINEILKSR
ncbi:MAG: pantetheine-phosphate adenylyltransferase [Clostridiales bacterium]|nr:pantetheine-phosphate adenylyltransferase [Clostridiales bacterium]